MASVKKPDTASPEVHREKLHDIVKGTRTVMLLSRGEAGKIVGRPMALVRTDDDTTVYLVTGLDTKKVEEIEREPRVSVAVQGSGGYAMLDGTCRVSRDRALIDELWDDSWKAWFENGKSDPDIAILVITPNEGTYWDGGLGHGLSYLYRMVKARLTGDDMEIKATDQGKVKLH